VELQRRRDRVDRRDPQSCDGQALRCARCRAAVQSSGHLRCYVDMASERRPEGLVLLWLRPRDMAKIGQLVLDRGRWNGAHVLSETWIKAATAPQIKTIYRGLDYGFQFWLRASSVSGRRIDWVEAQGQGGQRIIAVPTLDLVTVVTAGNYYGNDRLANLVPQMVFDDYVLPSVDAAR